MRKKIAVITLHAVKNYGSILQTYATQCVFERLGYDVTIIDYRRKWETARGYFFYHKPNDTKDILRQMIYFPSKIKQKKVFERFLLDKINLSKVMYTSDDELLSQPVEADVYCTGSDQVWNSGWNDGIICAYFLSFVPDDKKKIAYAASFGTECISREEQSMISGLLNRYDAISVREVSSVNLLKNMGVTEARVVLDPTLQLERGEWLKLIRDRTAPVHGYVLLIQLYRNHRFDNFAVEFARKTNKRLVRLCLRMDQVVLPGEHAVIPEVVDYLNYINNADYILTDSFHAISFSLNFNKEFFCVLPDEYSVRLKSILSITGLESRIISDYQLRAEQMEPIPYEAVNCDIERIRRDAGDFLREALAE